MKTWSKLSKKAQKRLKDRAKAIVKYKCWICAKYKRINQWSFGKETYIPASLYANGKITYAIIPQPVCKRCIEDLVNWIKAKRQNDSFNRPDNNK